MISCILLMLALEGGPIWTVPDTGTFQLLRREQAHMAPNGRVYLLIREQTRVHIYDNKGNKIKEFGSKGKGPGELIFPNRLFSSAEHLYIQDPANGMVICFSFDGEYVSQTRLPEGMANMVRMENGWIYGTWRLGMGMNHPGYVAWADESFANTEIIIDRRDGGDEGPTSLSLSSNQTMPFDPAADRPHLVADPEGKFAYFQHPGPHFKISVINPRTKQVERTIEKDWKRLPFDEEWGQSQIAQQNKANANSSFQLKVKGDFPSHFPHIRNIAFWGEHLYLESWTINPNRGRLRVLDKDGTKCDPAIPVDAFERIGGIKDGNALVFTFDEEADTAGMALVPLAGVADFIKANPLPEVAQRSGFVIQ